MVRLQFYFSKSPRRPDSVCRQIMGVFKKKFSVINPYFNSDLFWFDIEETVNPEMLLKFLKNKGFEWLDNEAPLKESDENLELPILISMGKYVSVSSLSIYVDDEENKKLFKEFLND